MRHAERTRGLHLPRVDGEDAAAQHLGKVRGRVERDRDKTGDEERPDAVDLRDAHAGALEEIEDRVVEDEGLHHHRRAADDEDVEAGEFVRDDLDKLHKVVVALVGLLNAEKDHEKRQHERDRRAGQRELNGRPHAGDEERALVVGHVDHGGERAGGVALGVDGGVDDVGELEHEAVKREQRGSRGVQIGEIAAQPHEGRALENGFAVAAPVRPFHEQRQRADDQKEIADRSERRTGHGAGGQKAVRTGRGIPQAQADEGDDAAAQINITVVPCDEALTAGRGGSSHGASSLCGVKPPITSAGWRRRCSTSRCARRCRWWQGSR